MRVRLRLPRLSHACSPPSLSALPVPILALLPVPFSPLSLSLLSLLHTLATPPPRSNHAHFPRLQGPIRLMIYDIHALQERFYFGDNIIPILESATPLFLKQLTEDHAKDHVPSSVSSLLVSSVMEECFLFLNFISLSL